MEETLYSRLFQYRERQHLRPEENYLTEILAWTIENIPSFAEEYIRFLLSNDKSESKHEANQYEVNYVYTQYKVTNGYIDLVIIANNNIVFICEHKINSNLSENQISKYLECKHEIDNNSDFKTVLVTKSKNQHKQDPDISITWYDIYKHFCNKVKDNSNNNDHDSMMVKQFLNYITEAGMGEKDPINNSAVEFYCEAMKLERQLTTMFADLVNENWYIDCPKLNSLKSHINPPQYYRKRWGRIGIEFCENWEKQSEDSNINIFVGVVVNNTDHQLCDFTSPQLVVLIDCFEELRKSQNLQDIFKDLNENESNGFKIEKEPKNPWRLLILKKPLKDVIKGDNYEKQKENIYNELIQGISIVLKYWKN